MSKMNTISMKCEIGEKKLSIETGKVALFGDGAVTVQYGDTVILATVVMEKEVKEGLDFCLYC